MCSSDLGSLLIGIVMPDGHVCSMDPPLEIDAGFVDKASADLDHPAESRFRFAGACVTTGCQQWRNEQCQVGRAAAIVAERLEITEELPRCAIRSRCRWWRQEGRAACAACAWVVHTTMRSADPAAGEIDERTSPHAGAEQAAPFDHVTSASG